MHILALTPAPYDTTPGQRFRIEQWARYLERDGCRFTFVPFADNALQRVLYARGKYVHKAALVGLAVLRRLSVLASLRRYDAVFVPREAAIIGPAVLERAVRALGAPLVYDFDDPIWLPYRSPTNGLLSCLKFPNKTAAICRLATRVTVGNRLLAEWARNHAAHCDVIPSTIDLEAYPARPQSNGRPLLTLGWTGSHSTLPFLDQLRDVLPALAQRQRFRLLVVSHTDRPRIDWLPDSVELVGRRWQAATEATDLHDIDIGLAPFPDSGWTPWRCHGKVLQYMAVGVPCVTSRLGVLPDYIADGENGFLASDAAEWIQKLSALMDNPALRHRLGAAGRQTIAQRYSAAVWAPRVREILSKAAGDGR